MTSLPTAPDFGGALLTLGMQRAALQAHLQDFATTADGGVLALWSPETFIDEVLSKARPAICLTPHTARDFRRGFAPLGRHEERESLVLLLAMPEYLEAAERFKEFGALFLPDLTPYRQSLLGLALTFGGDDDYFERAFVQAERPVGLTSVIGAETVRLTAPPAEELFPEVSTRSLKDEFYWGRVRSYERWLDHVSPDRNLEGSIQIGGWGEFIETGDDTTYVAQVNVGVGDCGRLYLLSAENQPTAHLQMF